MTIAIVTTSYPAFSGDPSGHFVETEARALARENEVFVVTPDGGAGSSERGEGMEERTERLTVLRLPGYGAFGWPGVASRIRERPDRALGALRFAGHATRALKRLGRLDRIVAHWSVPSGWPIASGRGVPLELVSHGADVRLLRGLPRLVRTRLVEELLLGATAWRFVSASLLTALLESLSKELAARASTIARVEASPIELPDVSPAAKERRARHEGVELAVCVGRLVAQKRVDRVVDFVAARATATRLVVVGDGPLRGRLETYALRRGVDALFLGRTARDEALAWIAAADFVVHASEAEGRSTVEREAQALGVPFRFVGTACTF